MALAKLAKLKKYNLSSKIFYCTLFILILLIISMVHIKSKSGKTQPKTPKKPNAASVPKSNVLTIHGFEGCGYFAAALNAAKLYKSMYPNIDIRISSVTRPLWENTINTHALSRGYNHRTSPLIFYNNAYVGGHDAFIAQLKRIVPFA